MLFKLAAQKRAVRKRPMQSSKVDHVRFLPSADIHLLDQLIRNHRVSLQNHACGGQR
jgi:hypothetical protein